MEGKNEVWKELTNDDGSKQEKKYGRNEQTNKWIEGRKDDGWKKGKNEVWKE